MTLAGLDGVERHAGGLQRRRAVTVDGGAGQEVVAQLYRHRATDVETGLAAWLTAAQHQVVDILGVQCGHLVEGGAHHLRGQVIRPHAHQRALAGSPDRGAGSGNDHGFGHENS
ncbi:Uncharacterised protein [Mycobacteroides abscessus subsp. abscessus]|nr:Uncharacterised protein [Mycobacteroides abscessus subsp. abscessus]